MTTQTTNTVITVDFNGLGRAAAATAQQALETWSTITGLQFEETNSGAELTFTSIATNSATMIYVDDNLQASGDAYFQAYVYEIGQALDMDYSSDAMGNDLISGNDGDDTLIGGAGEDKLIGGNGNDTLIGGNNADTLIGGNGNDILSGGNANDILVGNDGNDRLNGGRGVDYLEGGAGADKFLFKSVAHSGDTIADFSVESGDTLDVTGVMVELSLTTADAVEQGLFTLVNEDNGAWLTLDGGAAGDIELAFMVGIDATEASVTDIWFA